MARSIVTVGFFEYFFSRIVSGAVVFYFGTLFVLLLVTEVLLGRNYFKLLLNV